MWGLSRARDLLAFRRCPSVPARDEAVVGRYRAGVDPQANDSAHSMSALGDFGQSGLTGWASANDPFGRAREPLKLEKISCRASDGYFPIEQSPGYVYSRLATEFSSVGKHVQIRFDMPDGRLVDDGFWRRGRCGSEFGHSHVRDRRQDRLAA